MLPFSRLLTPVSHMVTEEATFGLTGPDFLLATVVEELSHRGFWYPDAALAETHALELSLAATTLERPDAQAAYAGDLIKRIQGFNPAIRPESVVVIHDTASCRRVPGR